jgi:hypothetical protein
MFVHTQIVYAIFIPQTCSTAENTICITHTDKNTQLNRKIRTKITHINKIRISELTKYALLRYIEYRLTLTL